MLDKDFSILQAFNQGKIQQEGRDKQPELEIQLEKIL